MRKRKLSLFKKIIRGIILIIPYVSFVHRIVVDAVDNKINLLAIKLLDKFGLNEFERIELDKENI